MGLSADAGLGLDPDADLARRAARALGTPAFATLAARTGVGARNLARQALAWRHGGPAGLESLGTEWDPAADDPDAARLLTAARTALRAKTKARPVSRATGSPRAACSCGSAATCAGIRTRDRTTTGSRAAPRRPIRPGPCRTCDASAAAGAASQAGAASHGPFGPKKLRNTDPEPKCGLSRW